MIKNRTKCKNNNLHIAKSIKNDEFYTRYEDIEKELEHYKSFLNNKIVYCNCDDYRFSKFVQYFKNNFHALQLNLLIATNYDIGNGAFVYKYDGLNESVLSLQQDGDFRNEECIKYLKESDVVVTNEPFSLFRKYLAQLMHYDKKFLIIGNMNAITYKEVFPYIKNNKLWLGNNYVKEFTQPDGTIKKFGNILWYTNIQHNKRLEPLDLQYKYNPIKYPKYDNYDAINVDKVTDIPIDYNGIIGVPITFLNNYCPLQFDILGHEHDVDGNGTSVGQFEINKRGIYKRILIKTKNNEISK